MFKGTDPGVFAAFEAAGRRGRLRGQSFVGSEHLLLELMSQTTTTADVLRSHGLTPREIDHVLEDLGGASAAVTADCRAVADLGLDPEALLAEASVSGRLLPAPPSHRVVPLGWRRAQRVCANARPQIAGDAQAAYSAALHLALAYWHRWLTTVHIAQVLVRWSRGSVLVADALGIDRSAALHDLDALAPPLRPVRKGHYRRAEALAA
jgi:hypothetical protein